MAANGPQSYECELGRMIGFSTIGRKLGKGEPQKKAEFEFCVLYKSIQQNKAKELVTCIVVAQPCPLSVSTLASGTSLPMRRLSLGASP